MKKGFTLIELIIYIGILVSILLVAFSFGWEIIYSNVKSQAIREVQQNARFCMEKITRIIKEAKAIKHPRRGNSSSRLSLEMTDPDLDPTTFDLFDNKLRITQGKNGSYELTNNRVAVSNLSFTNLSYSDTPGTIQIEIDLEHINPINRSEYQATFELKSTASLVPGGAIASEEGYCQGSPASCNGFGDQTSCENQGGCLWNPSTCAGTCTSCRDLDFVQCLTQEGCRWNWRRLKCHGNCASCSNFNNQSECEGQLGCSWTTPYCSGAATPCENYTSETNCTSQDGCQWISP